MSVSSVLFSIRLKTKSPAGAKCPRSYPLMIMWVSWSILFWYCRIFLKTITTLSTTNTTSTAVVYTIWNTSTYITSIADIIAVVVVIIRFIIITIIISIAITSSSTASFPCWTFIKCNLKIIIWSYYMYRKD
jgi:Kef-type K+ transport system membrane component KefB